MKTINVRFHRVHRYTDPTGMFKIKVEFGLSNVNKLMGKMTGTCDEFPDVTSIIGPFDPLEIMELEKRLKLQELEEDISNLIFEEEITGFGIVVKSPEHINMN